MKGYLWTEYEEDCDFEIQVCETCSSLIEARGLVPSPDRTGLSLIALERCDFPEHA